MIILTIESEFASVSQLGYETLVFLDDYYTNDVVLRWGNSHLSLYRNKKDFQKVINPAKAIKLNCHKLKALMKMSKVVHVPEIYEQIPENQLALIRPINHSDGDDFKVVQGSATVPDEYYATSWISTSLEYRVWFAGDAVLCAERVGGEASQYPCRSNWDYKFLDSVPSRLHSDVLDAASIIGLSVGAADVLVKDDKYYFLELNSAPSIDDDKIKKFFKLQINRILGGLYAKRRPRISGGSLE